MLGYFPVPKVFFFLFFLIRTLNAAKKRYAIPCAVSEKPIGMTFWETNRVLKYLFPKMLNPIYERKQKNGNDWEDTEKC